MASDPLPCRFCGTVPTREEDRGGAFFACPADHCLASGPLDDPDHAKWDAMTRGGPVLAPEDCIEVRGWVVVDGDSGWLANHVNLGALSVSGRRAYPIRVRLPKPQPQPVIDAEVIDDGE